MASAIIGPITFDLDDAKVTIIEVSKYTTLDNKTRYIVSMQVEYGGYLSPIFQLDVANNDELISKLRTEIAKMKIAIHVGFTRPFTKLK